MGNVLRDEYNHLLKKFNKACAYLEDNSIPYADREKWLPEFEKITNRLNDIVTEINKQGVYPTNERLLYGL